MNKTFHIDKKNTKRNVEKHKPQKHNNILMFLFLLSLKIKQEAQLVLFFVF